MDLGLVSGGVGAFSLFIRVSLGGGVDRELKTLKNHVSFTSDSYTFAGAKISELHSVSSNIQTHLNN